MRISICTVSKINQHQWLCGVKASASEYNWSEKAKQILRVIIYFWSKANMETLSLLTVNHHFFLNLKCRSEPHQGGWESSCQGDVNDTDAEVKSNCSVQRYNGDLFNKREGQRKSHHWDLRVGQGRRQGPSTAHPFQHKSWWRKVWMTGGDWTLAMCLGQSPGGRRLGQVQGGSTFQERTFFGGGLWGPKGTLGHRCTWAWREHWQDRWGRRRTATSRWWRLRGGIYQSSGW